MVPGGGIEYCLPRGEGDAFCEKFVVKGSVFFEKGFSKMSYRKGGRKNLFVFEDCFHLLAVGKDQFFL